MKTMMQHRSISWLCDGKTMLKAKMMWQIVFFMRVFLLEISSPLKTPITDISLLCKLLFEEPDRARKAEIIDMIRILHLKIKA